jgi:hypothetical protein
MNSRPELRLDWCTHEAAKYAVENWHYSKSMPPPPHLRIGVWEASQFSGVILFARGATGELLSPYGLKNTEGCELVRIALRAHKTPVSRMLSIALKFLKKTNPRLRLVVSFADPAQEHHGGIYQATNWLYAGQSASSSMYRDRSGKLWHERMISPSGRKKVFGKIRSVLRPDQCERIRMPGKHRYLMPLDDEMRKRIEPLRKPYPKRAGSAASGTSPIQGGGGGATPASALDSSG